MATAKTPQDRKPAKKAAAKPARKRVTPPKAKKEVTSIAEWKKPALEGVDLELPSGNVCRAKPIAIERVLGLNIIPNELVPIMMEALGSEGSGDIGGGQIVNALGGPGEKAVTQITRMVDQMAMKVVLEPQLTDNLNGAEELIPDESRDPEKLYVDEVDFQDKMYIFSWAVGGSPDLKSFRP